MAFNIPTCKPLKLNHPQIYTLRASFCRVLACFAICLHAVCHTAGRFGGGAHSYTTSPSEDSVPVWNCRIEVLAGVTWHLALLWLAIIKKERLGIGDEVRYHTGRNQLWTSGLGDIRKPKSCQTEPHPGEPAPATPKTYTIGNGCFPNWGYHFGGPNNKDIHKRLCWDPPI